jgi:hypothetical protein
VGRTGQGRQCRSYNGYGEEKQMTFTQLVIQTAVTFVAASVGAIFGAFLTRRTEKFKHLQELRSAAYVDFVRGVSSAAERAQSGSMNDEHSIARVADSRARIAIYGGKDVIHSLSKFIVLGGQTCNPDGMQAFAALCGSMRHETGREQVSTEDIKRILYN